MSKRKTQTILSRLMELHPKTIDLSLGRVERLLGLLGNPEKKLPPIVHVAGTNGKGSVIAMLNAILRCSGYDIHTYTSPHLINFNERITLCGHLIKDEIIQSILNECEQVNDGAPITFFEITTAAAFVAFNRVKADILLLEVGLGGRLDATNVVSPLISAITSVSIDHQQFLGDTITEIAREKAGILKTKTPAIIGIQTQESLKVIEERAKKINVPIYRGNYEWEIKPTKNGMIFHDETSSLHLPRPILLGDHQIDNAGIAVATAKHLSKDKFKKINSRSIIEGIKTTVWAGRMQQVTWPGLASDWQLWLDGGHNSGASKAICSYIESWGNSPVHIIIGMIETKNVKDFIIPIAKNSMSITTLAIPGQPASVDPSIMLSYLNSIDIDKRQAMDIKSAISQIHADFKNSPGRILVCGSLYLVGEALKIIKY